MTAMIIAQKVKTRGVILKKKIKKLVVAGGEKIVKVKTQDGSGVFAIGAYTEKYTHDHVKLHDGNTFTNNKKYKNICHEKYYCQGLGFLSTLCFLIGILIVLYGVYYLCKIS